VLGEQASKSGSSDKFEPGMVEGEGLEDEEGFIPIRTNFPDEPNFHGLWSASMGMA
jgi:hypothetical protein